MWIIEVCLKNFGKFRDKRILLSEGINLIYGENESGKSTIYAGIRGILFGMDRGRGKAAKNDAFSRYEPWEDSNYYAGMIRFISGGKSFCLDRKFDKYGKCANLFCENDGEELSVEHGDLTVLLEGLDQNNFEETVSVGQMKVETGSTLVASLKDYAANYFSTGNSEINLSKAIGILRERRKNIDREIRELMRKKQEKRDKLELESSYIWRDLRSIEKEQEKWKEEVRRGVAEKEAWEEREEKEQEELEQLGRLQRYRVNPLVVIGMLVAVILSLIFIMKPWNYLVSVVLILAEGLFVWNRLKDGRRKKDAVKDAEYTELVANLNKVQWQLDRINEEYQEKRMSHSNLREEIAELDEVSEEFKAQNKKREALEYAEKMLQISAMDMQKRLEERLNERLSEIVCTLTDGKYDKVWVDDELHICLYSEGRRIDMEQVSRGTVEQIYFALRMAAIEIMHTEEFPIILDDTFAYYDDKRMEAAIKWLSVNKRQVIIFTCHKREEDILQKNGIVYNKIML